MPRHFTVFSSQHRALLPQSTTTTDSSSRTNQIGSISVYLEDFTTNKPADEQRAYPQK